MNLFRTEDIIYEDKAILVCRKHAGLAVQSARSGQMDLESALKNYLALKRSKGNPDSWLPPYLGVIQRLDQPVEGVLVFAKTPAAAAGLTKQLKEGRICKSYLAMVSCGAAPEKGMLEDYLYKDSRTNRSKVTTPNSQGSKKAVLKYRCLGQEEDRALLEIELLTGRHHQIRVQLAHAGMPILGDQKYNKLISVGIPLSLCAYKLEFNHPGSKKRLKFEISPENPVFYPTG